MPEEEKEEQETEKLLEKIMKENFPNLVKELNMEVRDVQRVPKKLDLRRNTPRHIIIKLPKIKDKERILKATQEQETVTYKGVPIRLSADFSKETLQARRGWIRSIQSHERQGPTSKMTPTSKATMENGRADKVLPRQSQVKGVHHHQALIT